MDARQLLRWQLAYEVVPLDDGWRQADTIAGAIHNESERNLAQRAGLMGLKGLPPEEWHKPGNYIPKLKFVKQKSIQVNQASIDVFQSMIEQQYGRRHNR